MQTDDQYLLLLWKKHEGTLLPDEDVMIQQWLSQSADHQRLADQIRQVWERSGQVEPTFQTDMEADFERVMARMRTADQAPAQVVHMGRWWLRAAAALALAIAAVGIWRSVGTPQVEEMSAVATAGSEKVSLPDGSTVWLRQNARLRYPARFEAKQRKVKLEGEAYFEVAHNPAQPFTVLLPNDDQVKVLGTSFGVSQRENGQTIHVQVRSGKVLLSTKEHPDGVVLTAYESANYDRVSGRFVVRRDSLLNHLAWQSGGLSFVRTPLRQVVADLEHHYQVRIQLLDPAVQECLYNSPRTDQPVEKVLSSIAHTYQMKVVTSPQGGYELHGGMCK